MSFTKNTICSVFFVKEDEVKKKNTRKTILYKISQI